MPWSDTVFTVSPFCFLIIYPINVTDMSTTLSTIGMSLEAAAASEVIAYYQYSVVTGVLRQFGHDHVADEFMRIAKDELDDHYLSLLGRMSAISHVPSRLFNMSNLVGGLSPCAYDAPVAVDNLPYLIDQNIGAEECAITVYTDLLSLPDIDSETYDVVSGILEDEKTHKLDLEKLL